VANLYEQGILEPLAVKRQVITSAVEAASTLLRIDEIVAASKISKEGPPKPSKEKEEGEKE